MKRDMDLIRAILLDCESIPAVSAEVHVVKIHGHSVADVNYHIVLLAEAGLLHTLGDAELCDQRPIYVDRLTWAGHDFIDAARDLGKWERAKSIARSAGNVTFEAFKGILVSLASEAISKAIR
jgi:hypothetical protein